MKKVMIMILIFSLMLLNGCGTVITQKGLTGNENRHKEVINATEIVNINVEDISKVLVATYPPLEEKKIELVRKEEITKFLKIIGNYEISSKPITDKNFFGGYDYIAQIYVGNMNKCNICFSNPLSIEGRQYNVTNPEVIDKVITPYLQSMLK